MKCEHCGQQFEFLELAEHLNAGARHTLFMMWARAKGLFGEPALPAMPELLEWPDPMPWRIPWGPSDWPPTPRQPWICETNNPFQPRWKQWTGGGMVKEEESTT